MARPPEASQGSHALLVPAVLPANQPGPSAGTPGPARRAPCWVPWYEGLASLHSLSERLPRLQGQLLRARIRALRGPLQALSPAHPAARAGQRPCLSAHRGAASFPLPLLTRQARFCPSACRPCSEPTSAGSLLQQPERLGTQTCPSRVVGTGAWGPRHTASRPGCVAPLSLEGE